MAKCPDHSHHPDNGAERFLCRECFERVKYPQAEPPHHHPHTSDWKQTARNVLVALAFMSAIGVVSYAWQEFSKPDGKSPQPAAKARASQQISRTSTLA